MIGAKEVREVGPGDTLDYRDAKLRLRTPHGKVGYCPVCGERGAIRISKAHPRGFKRDMVQIQHRAAWRQGPFPHWSSQPGDHHLVAFEKVEGKWDPTKAPAG